MEAEETQTENNKSLVEKSSSNINIQPETSSPTVEHSSNPKNKLLLPLVLAVTALLLILVVAGIFLFKNFKNTQTNISSTPIQPTTTKGPPSPTPDPTADWKTYTNTEYGYLIKYPSQLTAVQGGKGIGDISKTTNISFVEQSNENSFQQPHFSISVRLDTGTLDKISASDYQYLTQTSKAFINESDKKISEKNLGFSITSNKVIEKINKTKFKGLPSYQYTILGSTIYNGLEEYLIPAEERQYIWVENNNKFYLISFTNTDIMKQILSTFRFLETTEKNQITKGTITGELCYPSSFLPSGEIVAKNSTTGKTFTQKYIGSLNGGKNSYTFSLPKGEYKIRYQAHASGNSPEVFMSGYYTTCSVERSTVGTCDSEPSHKIIPVSVIPNQTIENIDLCDFYYGENQEPEF